MENEIYMKPKEVQEYLQIGKNKVYSLCELKGFPAVKIGSNWRINRKKFERWLEQHEGMIVDL